jgi:hypothetical protein
MTVINNIEIDNICYQKNIIKDAILNNKPIDKYLHVIIVISNPCLYAIRYILARDFIKRMENEKYVKLYIVEVAYGNQTFCVSEKGNPRHLQIRTDSPALWIKENMINIGVKKLLPSGWKAFAWIDADIEFENTTWAKDTLKILNGTKDIVQIFSHAVDMDKNGLTMNVFNSAGYQYTKENKYSGMGPNYWHPGFAWACTKKAYKQMGGLYQDAILGSGDNIMSLSLIQNGLKAINPLSTDGYKKSIQEYQDGMKGLRFGYVPGVIRHYYHGSKKNRKYTERWLILVSHNYDPYTFIKKDKSQYGLIIPTDNCPTQLLEDIMNYFKERNEDEDFSSKDFIYSSKS